MLLFKSYFKVPRHAASKNEKNIYRKSNGQLFIGKENKTIACQNWILRHLQLEMFKQKIYEPILCDLNAKFIFYFPESVFYTKKGIRSQTIPDLSNLYELVQDCLQYDFCTYKKKDPRYRPIKIIGNDSQICSHDGSLRLPIKGSEYYLSIELSKRCYEKIRE